MQPQDDLQAGLSAIEIAFFEEGEQPPPVPNVGAPRAHLSRYVKWVAAVVAAGLLLLLLAAHERKQTEARGPEPSPFTRGES